MPLGVLGVFAEDQPGDALRGAPVTTVQVRVAEHLENGPRVRRQPKSLRRGPHCLRGTTGQVEQGAGPGEMAVGQVGSGRHGRLRGRHRLFPAAQ